MLMKKRYVVRLNSEERERLEDGVTRGREADYRRRPAPMLVLADEGEPGRPLMEREVAERVGGMRCPVEQIRERCVGAGLPAALERRKRARERARVLDGEGQARLVSLACSEPPAGRSRWTLTMPGDWLVEVAGVESIAAEAVRLSLKNPLKPWQKRMGCLPEPQRAAFVGQRTAVLAGYCRAPDPSPPVVCLEETRGPWVREVRAPIPAKAGQSERYDMNTSATASPTCWPFMRRLRTGGACR
jgi:hypothetical protein